MIGDWVGVCTPYVLRCVNWWNPWCANEERQVLHSTCRSQLITRKNDRWAVERELENVSVAARSRHSVIFGEAFEAYDNTVDYTSFFKVPVYLQNVTISYDTLSYLKVLQERGSASVLTGAEHLIGHITHFDDPTRPSVSPPIVEKLIDYVQPHQRPVLAVPLIAYT